MRGSMMMAGVLALSLAGCSGDKEGTTISFNSTDSDGNVAAGVDGKTGEMSINAPGFSGKITLPKMKLGSDDFDLNGVKLYPGSTITTMNIAANSDGKGEGKGDSRDKVRIVFDSPATPEKVIDYFADKLAAANFKLTKSGQSLKGTDEDNKPFMLDVKPAANGHSTGTIAIEG